jgi:hypothetical protein
MPPVIALVACGHGAARPAAASPPPSPSASAVPALAAAAPPAPSGSTAPVAASAAPLPPAPVPISTVATTRSDPAWAACHRSTKARGGDPASDVAALAGGCAASTRMKLVGATRTGKQAAEDAPQSFPLEAKGHHCYRVYARAAESIEDLDVVVKDSAGVVIGQDSTDDRSPVVLEDGEVCFRQDDKASVVVSVGMGKGSYAFQIWGD